MKTTVKRNTSGSYIVSSMTSSGLRVWEVCKEYDSDSESYAGKFWYIYETTNDMREWYGYGFSRKSDAIKEIENSII